MSKLLSFCQQCEQDGKGKEIRTAAKGLKMGMTSVKSLFLCDLANDHAVVAGIEFDPRIRFNEASIVTSREGKADIPRARDQRLIRTRLSFDGSTYPFYSYEVPTYSPVISFKYSP